MKKKFLLMSLLSLLTFASCQGGGGTSSLTEDNPNTNLSSEIVNEAVFPSDEIKAFFNTDEVPPTFSGDVFYTDKVDNESTKCFIVYTEKNDKASNSYFLTYLASFGYGDVGYDSDNSCYYAYGDENLPYTIVFYEEEVNSNTYFIVQYYYSDENGGGGEIYDDYKTSTTFPTTDMQEFFGSSTSLVTYSASEFNYIGTLDEDGYYCFFIYSYDNSTTASGYAAQLTNEGYTVEEYEDEDGPYYYAYNDETGYELLFWDDSSDDSLNLQIYYYGGDNGGDDSGDTGEDGYTLYTSSLCLKLNRT